MLDTLERDVFAAKVSDRWAVYDDTEVRAAGGRVHKRLHLRRSLGPSFNRRRS